MTPPDLPEREWLSIAELADRWGVSEGYVMHLGAQDLLRMGVLADGWKIRVEPLEAQTAHDRNHKGFTALCARDIASIEQRGEHIVDEVRMPTEGEIAAGHMPVFSDDPMWGVTIDQDILAVRVDECTPTSSFAARSGALVRWRDLLVRRADREHFEHVYGIGGKPKEPEGAKQLTDSREEKSYLQLIRLAMFALDLPSEPYKAAHAIQELAAQQGVEVRSERTVAEILKRAHHLDD